MQEFLSLSRTLVCLFLRSRSAKTFASLVTRERVENCSSIKLLVTRYGERLRFDDDIVFLGLSSRATNNFSRKLWRLANDLAWRCRAEYIIKPMQIIYDILNDKTHLRQIGVYTRVSLLIHFFFLFLNRIDSTESSDANFLGPAAIKQK